MFRLRNKEIIVLTEDLQMIHLAMDLVALDRRVYLLLFSYFTMKLCSWYSVKPSWLHFLGNVHSMKTTIKVNK